MHHFDGLASRSGPGGTAVFLARPASAVDADRSRPAVLGGRRIRLGDDASRSISLPPSPARNRHRAVARRSVAVLDRGRVWVAQATPDVPRCVHSPAILPYSTASRSTPARRRGPQPSGPRRHRHDDLGSESPRTKRLPSVHCNAWISCPTCDRDNPVRFLDGGYAGESDVDESPLPAEGGTGSGLGASLRSEGPGLLPEEGAVDTRPVDGGIRGFQSGPRPSSPIVTTFVHEPCAAGHFASQPADQPLPRRRIGVRLRRSHRRARLPAVRLTRKQRSHVAVAVSEVGRWQIEHSSHPFCGRPARP